MRADDTVTRRLGAVAGPSLPSGARLSLAELVCPLSVLEALAKITAVYVILQALAGLGAVELRPRFFVAAATFALFALLGRRLQLAADGTAGDLLSAPPRRGRWLWRGAAVGAFALQLIQPSPLPLGAALLTVGLVSVAAVAAEGEAGAARGRWARAGWIAGSAGSLLYGGAVFVADFGVEALDPSSALLFLGLWLPLVAWALVRFLPRGRISAGSVVLPTVLVVATEVCVLAVAQRAGLVGAYDVFVCAAAIIAVASYIVFALNPSRDARRIQLPTASFVLALDLGLLMAAAVALRGPTW